MCLNDRIIISWIERDSSHYPRLQIQGLNDRIIISWIERIVCHQLCCRTNMFK